MSTKNQEHHQTSFMSIAVLASVLFLQMNETNRITHKQNTSNVGIYNKDKQSNCTWIKGYLTADIRKLTTAGLIPLLSEQLTQEMPI